MRKLKVGIYAFSESKAREDVYQQRFEVSKSEVSKVIKALEPHVEVFFPEPQEIRTMRDVKAVTRQMYAEEVDAVIFLIPIFVVSSQVAMAGRLINIPPILIGNRIGTASQTGLFAAGGALNQVSVNHKRMIGDLSDETILNQLLVYLRGVAAVSRLRGQTFGCFGGRSLGIITGVSDGAQWLRLFGVDIEHIDQSVLIRYAEETEKSEVDRHLAWVKDAFGKVEIPDSILEKQVRSYIATKRLINELELDFIGVKCQTDLSDWYCLQCLNLALVGDPYDVDGAKEPIVASCEADSDGALTMQILKLISGGKPTALTDLKDINSDELILANCGSSPTWFAGASEKQTENTQEVHLLPHVFGKAGGGSLQFVFKQGTVTLARLCRKNGEYYMAAARGETVEKPRSELKKTGWVLPHAFIKSDLDVDEFIQSFDSNHVHIVKGDYVEELRVFCNTVGIPLKIYNLSN